MRVMLIVPTLTYEQPNIVIPKRYLRDAEVTNVYLTLRVHRT